MADHAKPEAHEIAAFYRRYIDACAATTLDDALRSSWDELEAVLLGIPESLEEHRYAPGKWSIKQMLQHMIDTERVMTYRGLRFARNDSTALPGFEEDAWAAEGNAGHRRLAQLIDEARTLRASSRQFFNSISTAEGLRSGTANGNPMTARGAGWVIAGHTLHHLRILTERYLSHAQS